MDRRLFLRSVGVATGALFIPDRLLLRAERFFENEGMPLLKTYRNPVCTILANEYGDLHIGDPFQGPERFPTWREYFRKCTGYTPADLTEEFIEDAWGLAIEDLDKEVEQDYYWGWWLQNESSGARAYKFLEPLDIGPEIHKNGEGWEEPVFDIKGNHCGNKRKFSDVCLIFMLKSLKPEVFADKPTTLVQNNLSIAAKSESEILASWRERLGATPDSTHSHPS